MIGGQAGNNRDFSTNTRIFNVAFQKHKMSDEKKDARLFIPRTNGSGWDMNWNSGWSYAYLVLILGLPFIVIIIVLCSK